MVDSSSVNNEMESHIPKNTLPPKQEQKVVHDVYPREGKIVYLTDDRTEPDLSDPQHDTWDAENSMVMTCLKEMYSDMGNKSQIYELTLKVREIQQGSDNVTKYFHSLKRVWQDLDLFNEIRGRIIGRATLPSLGEVFSEVRREESRRSVMMVKAKVDPTPPETNALVVDVDAFKSSNQRNSSNSWCDYCHKPRHTREICWKLHGKPAHMKNGKPGPRPPRSVPTTHGVEKTTLNNDRVEELIRLLKSSSLSGIPNVSLAQTGPDFGEDDWQC
ncbi:hypothetical protein QL285_003107 [Trifolium repens]|nr:hypothetical protein QL285_003107 [Trifolium repens]